MKTFQRILVVALLVLFNSLLFAQKETPKLPIDPNTRKITYSEVVNVDSLSTKDELFSCAREWFAKAYNSSTNVIQLEDKENGKIIGKALIQVYHKAMGSNYPSGYINYTISIYLKNGRYKYEITDFHHTGDANIMVCEEMINTTKGKLYQKVYNYYLYQMDNNIRDLIIGFKAAMSKKTNNTKKDNW